MLVAKVLARIDQIYGFLEVPEWYPPEEGGRGVIQYREIP